MQASGERTAVVVSLPCSGGGRSADDDAIDTAVNVSAAAATAGGCRALRPRRSSCVGPSGHARSSAARIGVAEGWIRVARRSAAAARSRVSDSRSSRVIQKIPTASDHDLRMYVYSNRLAIHSHDDTPATATCCKAAHQASAGRLVTCDRASASCGETGAHLRPPLTRQRAADGSQIHGHKTPTHTSLERYLNAVVGRGARTVTTAHKAARRRWIEAT